MLLLLVILLGAATAGAQDYQARIYQSYLEGDMERWKEIMVDMERRYHFTGDPELLYELTEVEYGYIGWMISLKKKKEARKLLDRSEQRIEMLLEQDVYPARTLSLKGAYYGYRVGLEPLKAPYFGRKSSDTNEKALATDPTEPQVWMEKANIEYYKPAVFGGSKEEAVPLYAKAVRLYEQDRNRTQKNWLYLNCLTGLAIAYENTGSIRKAGDLYRRILKMEPGFNWVRDDLYPEFRKNHPGN